MVAASPASIHTICVRLPFVNHWLLTAGALTSLPRRGYSLRVDYTQLFRKLRESRGLTLEQLAELARVHRNTVVNIESGRPVKFKTIAQLMRKMGYAAESTELRSIALLWLESVSGIPFSRAEAEGTARQAIAGYRAPLRQAARELEAAVTAASLSPQAIGLLIFAAQTPEVLSILEQVRALTQGAALAGGTGLELKAAEDAADYGARPARAAPAASRSK